MGIAKTIHPEHPCTTYNEWIVHIYKLLNYPINDNGTKTKTTERTDSEIGVRQISKSIRTSQQNRAIEKTNLRGKA